jgi:hypothetical protein
MKSLTFLKDQARIVPVGMALELLWGRLHRAGI